MERTKVMFFLFPLQFSSYVNVTRNPMNCSVLDVEESLSCRISKAFRLRYRQAVRQLERTALGVVAVGTDPPKSGK